MCLFKKKKEVVEVKKLNMDGYDIKATIKGIMMWERLFNTNYFKMDNQDIMGLIYCFFTTCNPKLFMTYPTFMGLLENNERFSTWIMKKMVDITNYWGQFNTEEAPQGGKESDENPEMNITDMVTSLIVDYGVDANYVMHEMDVWEIEPLYKAAESRVKRRYEENRLWTYIQLLPNMDSKKSTSPEKLLPFPWEKEENKTLNENETKAAVAFLSKAKKNG